LQGVDTAKGFIKAKKVAVSAAGNTSVLMDMRRRAHAAGELIRLQALGLRAGEAGLSLRGHVQHRARLYQPVRQGRAGDRLRHRPVHLSYSASAAACRMIEHTLAAICELFPHLHGGCGCCGNWGGIVDVTPDRSLQSSSKTPVPGLYVNCGWGTGGFKATPGAAHTSLHYRGQGRAAPHQRTLHAGAVQATGRLIDEAAAAAVAH
jgi:sarcosine oxidase subunit beta